MLDIGILFSYLNYCSSILFSNTLLPTSSLSPAPTLKRVISLLSTCLIEMLCRLIKTPQMVVICEMAQRSPVCNQHFPKRHSSFSLVHECQRVVRKQHIQTFFLPSQLLEKVTYFNDYTILETSWLDFKIFFLYLLQEMECRSLLSQFEPLMSSITLLWQLVVLFPSFNMGFPISVPQKKASGESGVASCASYRIPIVVDHAIWMPVDHPASTPAGCLPVEKSS